MEEEIFGKVVFAGIGNMGWPMAARLVDAGCDVAVYDAAPGRAEAFTREVGGKAGTDIQSVIKGADIIITCLSTIRHVAEFIELPSQFITRGILLIEMSSGTPDVIGRLAAGLGKASVMMVDAQVSGGVDRAKTGELAIMLGGLPESRERAARILQLFRS